MYDIFYITDFPELDLHLSEIRLKFPNVKTAPDVKTAQTQAFTKMLWIVWPSLKLSKTFSFDIDLPFDDLKYGNVFKNSNGSNGVCLIPKNFNLDQPEPFATNIKEHDIIAGVSIPYDIVFISNGETNADEHWKHLKNVTKLYQNKLHRVDGVNSRRDAYMAAANSSATSTFFAVFAKIKVSDTFDWSWTGPAYSNAHYIFNAINPVNGLVYGHQAIIAYNKKQVLTNTGDELDFTLAQSHQVIDILSGTAEYNTSPKTTWRTAFREALKLRHYSEVNNDSEASDRLCIWLSPSDAPYGSWSQQGAADAVEYYSLVNGAYDKLMLSYEWGWLDQYFHSKHTA